MRVNAMIQYWLSPEAAGPATLVISEIGGTGRHSVELAEQAGIQRYLWDLRLDPEAAPPGAVSRAAGPGRAGRGGRGAGTGRRGRGGQRGGGGRSAGAGSYLLTLEIGGESVSTSTLQVRVDPQRGR
jgi:hypothetical protein